MGFLDNLLQQLITETNPNVARAREMRPFSMKNPDETYSTHKMASADNKAYPTIFPLFGHSQDTKDWLDLSNMPKGDWTALNKAIALNEVLSFGTEQQAREFAEGSWKPRDMHSNPSGYWKDLILSLTNLFGNGKSKP